MNEARVTPPQKKKNGRMKDGEEEEEEETRVLTDESNHKDTLMVVGTFLDHSV